MLEREVGPLGFAAPTITHLDSNTVQRIDGFVRESIGSEDAVSTSKVDTFWDGLRRLGTELWLDTGDIEGAASLWTQEFSALTTNNTLLNAEVQKGIYDDLIDKSKKVLEGVDAETKVVEIAFILNAVHGLRLVKRFGGYVSVELHTHLAHDISGTLSYARRYFRLCPERFIVKIPLTPAGLISTRTLREEGVPINFTLGFSARHNYLATGFSKPSYVNVFLGRLNSYVTSNDLGDGLFVGEKATLASQNAVAQFAGKHKEATKQIAASMRGASQVADLAGVDVMTMPLKVAQAAKQELSGTWTSQRDTQYEVSLADGVEPGKVRLQTLWEVSAAERELLASLESEVPQSGTELVDRAHTLRAGDLFPKLTSEDLSQIAADGKIPVHSRWQTKVEGGELAVDTLLNLAGLASFSADQKKLDDRIRSII